MRKKRIINDNKAINLEKSLKIKPIINTKKLIAFD
jgi:hypothetical protein